MGQAEEKPGVRLREASEEGRAPGLGQQLLTGIITQLVSSSNESLHFSGDPPVRGLTENAQNYGQIRSAQHSAGGRQTGCFDCIVHIWQQNSNNFGRWSE